MTDNIALDVTFNTQYYLTETLMFSLALVLYLGQMSINLDTYITEEEAENAEEVGE